MSKHIRELDGLRGIAVLIVICAHFHGLFEIRHGALGVDIFFTLSGFLMTRILISEIQGTSSICLINFYARRMLRLAPALIAVVVFVSMFYLAWGISTRTVASFSVPALLYFSNWIRAFDLWNLAALGHTWSLAIEEQFYILWPLILLVACRIFKTDKIVLLCLALTVLVISHRLIMLDGGATFSRISNGFDTRVDTILVGSALGALALSRSISFSWLPYAALLGAAFLLFVLIYEPSWYYHLGTTGVAISTACIIANAVVGSESLINLMLRNRFLLYSGRISYGLYLWHYPIYKLFWMVIGEQGYMPNGLQAVDLFLLLPLTYAVSATSFMLIESPALRLKERFVAGAGRLKSDIGV